MHLDKMTTFWKIQGNWENIKTCLENVEAFKKIVKN